MQKTYNRLFIIYAAFFFSSFVYLIVAFALLRSNWHGSVNSPNVQQILFWVMIAISVSDLFLASQIKRRMFGDELSTNQNSESVQKYVVSRAIVLYALAEFPAILGLIYFIVCGDFTRLLILWAVSLIAFVMVRPSQAQFDELDRRFPQSS